VKRRWGKYFDSELQASNAFERIEEALDGFFIGVVFEPGGECIAPCRDDGGDVWDEGRLVGIVGVESRPEHAPFGVERDRIAERARELGRCDREGCILRRDMVTDVLPDASWALITGLAKCTK